jgi:HSP20 family molecular chaperone IbpA
MNTTRLTLFDSPLFLGFDHFEKTFDRMRKSAAEGYPPYNIEQIGENGFRITIAVAGFTMDDLEIELDNNQLSIRGRQQEDESDRLFLHRGIASRQFQRSFVLADGIKIEGACLDNGLLHIDMIRVQPESKARKIEITSPNSDKNGKASPQAIDVEETTPPSGKKNGKK